MSLQIQHITKDLPSAPLAEKLLLAEFPPSELIPFKYLLSKAKRDFAEFLAFYDEDLFVGLCYTVSLNDFTLVLFLAVDSALQSKGYGSQALQEVCSRYSPNRLALEIEVLDPQATNYEQRVRRKAFYEKNGFTSSGLCLEAQHEVYEIMVYGGKVEPSDMLGAYRALANPLLFPFTKPKVYAATGL